MELTIFGTDLDMTEKEKYLPSRSDESNYLNQGYRNKYRKIHTLTVKKKAGIFVIQLKY